MKLFKTWALRTLCIISLFSCGIDSDEEEQFTTDLEVTIVNAQNQPVSNATVAIFRNRRDWESLSRIVTSNKTNERGTIIFEDLRSTFYYLYATFEADGTTFSNQFIESIDGEVFINGNNFNVADILIEDGLTKVSVAVKNEVEITRPESFAIRQADMFFVDEASTDVPPETDTLNYVLFTTSFYNSEVTANENLGQALDNLGFRDFRDQSTRNIGDRKQWRGDENVTYNLGDIVEGKQTVELVSVPRNEVSGTLFNDPTINTLDLDLSEFLVPPYRIKDVGAFSYGNDLYTLDLIVEWK